MFCMFCISKIRFPLSFFFYFYPPLEKRSKPGIVLLLLLLFYCKWEAMESEQAFRRGEWYIKDCYLICFHWCCSFPVKLSHLSCLNGIAAFYNHPPFVYLYSFAYSFRSYDFRAIYLIVCCSDFVVCKAFKSDFVLECFFSFFFAVESIWMLFVLMGGIVRDEFH